MRRMDRTKALASLAERVCVMPRCLESAAFPRGPPSAQAGRAVSLFAGVDAFARLRHFAPMSLLTIELPDALASRLTSASEQKHLPPSQIIREALEKALPAEPEDVETASPGIDLQDGVCGGVARVVRTRIPVWTLEAARRQGLADAAILAAFPSLRPGDLANAWNYARRHEEEINRQIAANADE